MHTEIENLGWDGYFESKLTESGLEDFAVARVIAERRGSYKIRNEKGEFSAKITGKQIFEAKSREDYPAVGDWVIITEADDDQAVINSILPRKSVIKRRFGDKNRSGEKNDVQIIASNIDVAFIVESVGRDLSVNRFERYLSIAKDAGIEPVAIINKVDLILPEELDSELSEIRSRLGDTEIITTSTVNDDGLKELKNYIQKGKTYCFLGSSGVGKSSLINKLLGKDDIRTGDVSSYSKRGKHVTTAREMYFLPAHRSLGAGGESGGIVIDNPGIREVGMTDVGAGVDSVFGEMAKLAQGCKYADCTHTHEPGCAVLEALEKEELDEDRYSNYVSLKKEAEYFEMSGSEKREKDRNFGKFMKSAKKDFRKLGHKDF